MNKDLIEVDIDEDWVWLYYSNGYKELVDKKQYKNIIKLYHKRGIYPIINNLKTIYNLK